MLSTRLRRMSAAKIGPKSRTSPIVNQPHPDEHDATFDPAVSCQEPTVLIGTAHVFTAN